MTSFGRHRCRQPRWRQRLRHRPLRLRGLGVVARLDGGANAGEAAGDTYANIEALYGSAFGDYLIGNSAGNVLAASTAPTCSTGLAAMTSCWAVVARRLRFQTPRASAPTPCRTSPPRLRQAPTMTMSTSAASAPSAASPSRRSVPMPTLSPTTVPSSAGHHSLDAGRGRLPVLRQLPGWHCPRCRQRPRASGNERVCPMV